MERFNYCNSLKNIPIPSKEYYFKQMIVKTDEFVQRLRWKAHFFLNPKENHTTKPTFGFKTQRSAPTIRELCPFENDLYDAISNIKFTEYRSPFQQKLKRDVATINKSKNIFVIADKTSNVYEMSTDKYNKLLLDNVTRSYRQTTFEDIDTVNREARDICVKLDIDDRVDVMSENPAFITIKHHKRNFEDNTQCRLINPAKSQIGKISKTILDSINIELRASLKLSQWKSTREVIDWFDTIENKRDKNFIQFDICEFYPSISEELLTKALDFAQSHDCIARLISKENREIIMHCRKSFLFTVDQGNKDGRPTPWTKMTGDFDVTMGAPDGAEVCELVGLYILNELSKNLPDIDFGLYRDDGLAVHKTTSGPQRDRVRKKIIAIFQEHGLKIEIDTNLKTVNFLDITLNLDKSKYSPYMKPNDKPIYVHNESNHPRCTLRQIPISINKRLSGISSSKSDFDAASKPYQDALDASKFKHKLSFNPSNDEHNKTRNRKGKREITWYTPPFSLSVRTNIGRQFIELVKKHFHPKSPLYKIFNKNTLKLSYSCTGNMKNVIQAHNRKILRPQKKTPCNCRKKDLCPLNGDCQESVVYKATLQHNNQTFEYIGSSENFKKRHSNHKSSFKNASCRNATALSKFVWENGVSPDDVTWTKMRSAKAYSAGSTHCNLCTQEKLCIFQSTNQNAGSLNKRTEVTAACRHRARLKLKVC